MPSLSILVIIGRIYRYQFKWNYLKNQKHFAFLVSTLNFEHFQKRRLTAWSLCPLFIFSPNDSPSKTMKMLFISSKKLFSFSRYSNFCISVLPVRHCCRGWSKRNLKVYDIINCLNKNLIIRFVWYLEKKKRYEFETQSIDQH